MNHPRWLTYVLAIALVSASSWSQAAEPADQVLRKYVQRPDDSYRWTIRQKLQVGPCQVTELTFTSQTWRGLTWKHRLFVAMPPGPRPETDAVLVIEGGSWKAEDAEPPARGGKAVTDQVAMMANAARQLNAPVALLMNVPSQPLFDREEDAIIALTFDEFVKSGDSDWPLLLPMVKSTVRAMDAVQAFVAAEFKLKVDRFTLTGASKRGWTAWLTAAIDPRVQALGPRVIDVLNFEAQFKHQLDVYGRFSQSLHDYTDRDLPQRMSGSTGTALRQIVDPYSYVNQIKQPKMIFLGTNDSFWTLDSLNLYWDALQGDRYIVYVPNADHDLARDEQRVIAGLLALHQHAGGRRKIPSPDWSYAEQAQSVTLTVNPSARVTKLLLWTADSDSRDFRKATWSSTPIADNAGSTPTATISRRPGGYRAMYAECTYAGEGLPLRLCTTIRVLKPIGN